MKNKINHAAAWGGAAFFVLSVVGLTRLLFLSLIGEATFAGLILVALAGACLIAFWGKIEYLKASEFEIRFREVKEAEDAVKALARDIVKLAEELNRGAIVTHEFDQAAFDRALLALKEKAGQPAGSDNDRAAPGRV